MSSGWLFADGRDPDAVFTAGNSGIVTGLLHQTSGADLGSLYIGGNSGITTKIKSKTGADIGSIFGTTIPTLGLPTSVTVGSGRTGGSVTLTYNSSGTWAFSTTGSATYTPSGAATSGTWLTSGTASQYTISMVGSGFTNGSDPGGGTDSYSTTCATPQNLASSQSCTVSAVAGGVGNNASNIGTWLVSLYKSGVLVGQQSFNVDVESAG